MALMNACIFEAPEGWRLEWVERGDDGALDAREVPLAAAGGLAARQEAARLLGIPPEGVPFVELATGPAWCGRCRVRLRLDAALCPLCHVRERLRLAALDALYPSSESLGLNPVSKGQGPGRDYRRILEGGARGRRVIRKSEPMGG